ncbi:hypothetical protein [Clostridium botulinum]|nr:hypothetical protein [Clostridium botulinum]
MILKRNMKFYLIVYSVKNVGLKDRIRQPNKYVICNKQIYVFSI